MSKSKLHLSWNYKPDNTFYLLPTILITKQNGELCVGVMWLFLMVGAFYDN